ncbi:MAG: hydroxyethylthiazole kinase [Negativicutes bacterium]
MEILEKIGKTLQAVRDKKPLVHHITNYVTVNDCANITLSIGASPVMADDVTEVAEMVSFASALVLNIGTLQTRTIESMLAAGKAAKAKGIPVIFDPVGVGATKLRTRTAEKIICDIAPNVIRGNMSEIKVLLGVEAGIRGVDSIADEQDAVEVVQRLAERLRCVVAVTGKTDVVAGSGQIYAIDNGHPIMAHVTGTGCMATSLVGSFCGAAKDDVSGTVAGILVMGLAGERAFSSLQGEESVGTFHARLFDEVYNMTTEKILKGGKVTQLK